MDCKEFRESLDLYVDRELSPEATVAARGHLEDCPACTRVEQQLQRMRNMVKRVVNEDELPTALVQSVSKSRSTPRAILEPRRAIPFWQKKVTIPMPAFAMILLAVVAIGAWTILRRTSTTLPTPQVGISKAPASTATSAEFDLNRFDRGERAAIYKVRISESGNERQ